MTKAELRDLKAATKKLTSWESSGKAFGHLNVIKKGTTVKKGADKIYEFFCLMKVLDDLRAHYNVTLQLGTRTGKIFPEAPSPKLGWPYFIIEEKSVAANRYQVCYGTEIKLSLAPLTTIAPDISIQNISSTDDPDETMVELIMDAKFKYKDDAALSIEQIHAFIQRVNALKTQGAPTLPLRFDKLVNMKSNCLLTNGRALAKQHQYCVLSNIKQIESFDSNGKAFNVVG